MPLAVNSRPRAAASWWFQASKKPLMAALTAARVHTLAAGALEAALGAAAPGLPADGWPRAAGAADDRKQQGGEGHEPGHRGQSPLPGDHGSSIRPGAPGPKFRDVNGYGYDTPGDRAVQRLKP